MRKLALSQISGSPDRRGVRLLVSACAMACSMSVSAQVAVESATLNSQATRGAGTVNVTQAVSRQPAAAQRSGTRTGRDAGQGGPSCTGGVSAPLTVNLSAGKSALINLPEPVVRRTQGDPAIVDSRMVSPQVLYLASGRIGSTNAILQGRSGHCTMLDIVVGIDIDALRGKLTELLPEEKGVVVSSAADSLVLSGTVSNPLAAEHTVAIANAFVRSAYQQGMPANGQGGGGAGDIADSGAAPLLARVVNLLGVGAPQQVMLEVKVAEISKAVLDRFGIDFTRAVVAGDGSMMRFLSGIFGGRGAIAGSVSDLLNPDEAAVGGGIVGSMQNSSATSALTGPGGNASIGGDTTTIPMIEGKRSTLIGIDAKKTDGLVKILAEPTVIAISGKEGSFLAGGKIFIPVAQTSSSGITGFTLEEKEFGVSLKFRPTVLADGRINLDVAPEVSELSAGGVTLTSAVTGATTVLPAFTTRKAATTVQLYDGQSFAIGGLMKSNVTGNIEAFPFLGELPVIGALFRSTSFQTDRSELVFVITPRLVRPLPADYRLPTDNYSEPSRKEVILGGRLESVVPTADANPQAPTRRPHERGEPGGFELM